MEVIYWQKTDSAVASARFVLVLTDQFMKLRSLPQAGMIDEDFCESPPAA